MAERRVFPAEWLAGPLPSSPGTDGTPSTPGSVADLDLVVLLVNSLDLLEAEPDRLGDLTWFRTALRQTGHGALADQLADHDLPALRRLREDLRSVFESADPEAVAQHLSAMLRRGRAVPVLVSDADRLRLVVAPDRTGCDALLARLPAALAAYVAEHGLARLGICGSDPCRCAFVDRTRAGTRRYCCGWCNDRRAARAYRRRRAGGA